MNKDTQKKRVGPGRPPGIPNPLYYPSKTIRVPIELADSFENIVKTYKEQKKILAKQLLQGKKL